MKSMLLQIPIEIDLPDGAIIVSHADELNAFNVVRVETIPEGYESYHIETTEGIYTISHNADPFQTN